MKKMNRKGFTIVELVIVIAVIAILAGVLIPTFSGIVEKAKISAEQQKVTNAYKEAYAEALIAGKGVITNTSKEVNDILFTFTIDNTGALSVAASEGQADGTGLVAAYNYTYNQATNTFTVAKR